MRQAITTHYIGPTNYKSGRVKATAAAGSVTVEWDHGLSIEGNHIRAAKALRDAKGWEGVWVGGGHGKDGGYVFVDASASLDHCDGVTMAQTTLAARKSEGF